VRWAWLAILGLAGCDKLFSLNHVDELPPDATLVCPTNYVELEGQSSRYRYIPTPQEWQKANDDCNNDREASTHLVVLQSVDEILAVRTLVTDVINFQLHVGYARNTVKAGGNAQVFYAVTGETLDYEAPEWVLWHSTEPNNVGDAETIVFIEDAKQLMDGNPLNKNRYVCECDGRPATMTSFILVN